MHLHAEQYGDGSPLIILHGLLGSGENWRTLSKRLGDHFRVFALDLRNHGRSPHSNVFSYPAMADDVRVFLEEQDLAPASMIGHSMGGKVAMHLALTEPTLIDRLVVADVAPKRYPPKHLELLSALGDLDLDQITSRKTALEALAPRIPNLGVRQFLLKNLVRGDDGSYSWQMNLPAIRTQYDGISDGIEADGLYEGPTLFIRGGASDYVRDGDVELIRAFFPHAELETLPDAGHWVHAEAPDAFFDAVLEFLKK